MRLERENVRPDCRHHDHVTLPTAKALIQTGDVRWINKLGGPTPRIYFVVQYTLIKRYVRTGVAAIGPRKQRGPGLPTMQLLRGSR